MRNATPVLPFKTRRPTHHHNFLRVNCRPFSFFYAYYACSNKPWL